MSSPSNQTHFNEAAKPGKKKRIAPLSVRVTEEERVLLKQLAGSRSVNSYVREKVFGDNGKPRRSYRAPRPDEKAIAKSLGALGQSGIASNLNQIAKAANMGALPVSQELTDKLKEACDDIRAMREALISALGLKVNG